MSLKALTERRTDLQNQMTELLETAKTEQRALTTSEIANFDSLETEIKNIDSTIEREERSNMNEKKETKAEMTLEERDIHAFADYIRSSVNNVECRSGEMAKTENGAVIPETIVKKIIEKVYDISPILEKATKYNAKGTVIVPKEDESTDSITVSYSTEFSDLVSHSNKFSTVELTGYLYGALTKISKSLLNNSDFNLTEWVVTKMAKKIAQFQEGEAINGTDSKIAGIAGSYDSTNMKITLANSSKISLDEIIDLMDKVPDQYQADAIFVMKRSTRNALRKLKDNEGRYLLNYDPTSKFGYSVFGHDIYCSDNMGELGATSENVVLFGDFSGLATKESETAEIQVLRETFATQHAIGVVAWGEFDAKVEDTQKIAVAVTPDA